MTGLNPSAAIDLAAVKKRRELKDRTPPYNPGTPTLVLTAPAPGRERKPSFSAAFDHVAEILAADGWSVVEFKECAVIGYEQAQDLFMFQVTVVVKQTESGQ